MPAKNPVFIPKFVPDQQGNSNKAIYGRSFGLPVINIRNVPLTDSFNAASKRLVDIFGATIALLLFADHAGRGTAD